MGAMRNPISGSQLCGETGHIRWIRSSESSGLPEARDVHAVENLAGLFEVEVPLRTIWSCQGDVAHWPTSPRCCLQKTVEFTQESWR